MICDDIADFRAALPPMQAIAGLDLGEKTIGVAVSDTFLSVATPLETVRRKKFTLDADRLLQIIAARRLGGLILGLPRNMDGSEGPRCQSARAFATNFEAVFDIDIAFWDERLSTVAVTRTMLEADLSRARQKEVVDKMAASYILQGALDYLANQRANLSDDPAS